VDLEIEDFEFCEVDSGVFIFVFEREEKLTSLFEFDNRHILGDLGYRRLWFWFDDKIFLWWRFRLCLWYGFWFNFRFNNRLGWLNRRGHGLRCLFWL